MSGRRADNLTRGTAIGIVGEALVLPTGLVSAAVLTRGLGLESYGLVGVVMAAVGPVSWILGSILGARTGVKIIAGASDHLAAASALLRLNALIGLAGALLFAGLSPLVARMLGHPEIALPLMLGAGELLLLPVARLHRDALIATGAYSRAGSAAGVFHLARLAMVIALVLAGLKVEAVILAILAARLAEIAWCRQRLAVPLGRRFDLRAEGLHAVLGPTFLYALCLRLSGSLDILILTAFGAAAADLSHYAAAQMLAQIPGLAVLVLVPGVIAAVTRAHNAGDARLAETITLDANRLFAVIGAGLLVAAGASPTLLPLIFGADFAGSAPLFALLILGGAGSLMLALSSAELLAEDRAAMPLVFALPMLAAMVTLQLVVVPRLGATGAAAVTGGVLLAAGLGSVLTLGARRAARLSLYGRAGFAGLAGGLCAWGLGRAGWSVADTLAGGGVALVLLYLTGVIDREIVLRFREGLGRGGPARRETGENGVTG